MFWGARAAIPQPCRSPAALLLAPNQPSPREGWAGCEGATSRTSRAHSCHHTRPALGVSPPERKPGQGGAVRGGVARPRADLAPPRPTCPRPQAPWAGAIPGLSTSAWARSSLVLKKRKRPRRSEETLSALPKDPVSHSRACAEEVREATGVSKNVSPCPRTPATPGSRERWR